MVIMSGADRSGGRPEVRSVTVSGLATSQTQGAGLTTPPYTNSSSKGNSRNGSSAERAKKQKRLPFEAKSFYLELKNAKSALIKKVSEEIRNLGGIVDDSFSKDTSYVVSNNEEARNWKRNHGSKSDDPRSTCPSPLVMDSPLDTPSPNASSPSAAPQASAAPVPVASVSRAQALLEKARVGGGGGTRSSTSAASQSSITGRSSAGSSRLTGILAKAKSLGIKVIHVDALLQLIEQWKQKLSSSRDNSPANPAAPSNPRGCGATTEEATEVANNSEVKIRTLKAPFIKFDDVSGVQKPVFAEFAEWPIIYLSDRPSTFSPFVKNGIGGRGEDKSEADADLAGNNNNNNARKKEKKVVFDGKEKGSEGTAAAANKKGRKNNIKQKAKEIARKKDDEKKAGFCECCQEYYKNGIDEHATSDKHKKFVADSSNFESLDKMIASLPSLHNLLSKFRLYERAKPSIHLDDSFSSDYPGRSSIPLNDEIKTPPPPQQPNSSSTEKRKKTKFDVKQTPPPSHPFKSAARLSPRFSTPLARRFSPAAKRLKMSAIATLQRANAAAKKAKEGENKNDVVDERETENGDEAVVCDDVEQGIKDLNDGGDVAKLDLSAILLEDDFEEASHIETTQPSKFIACTTESGKPEVKDRVESEFSTVEAIDSSGQCISNTFEAASSRKIKSNALPVLDASVAKWQDKENENASLLQSVPPPPPFASPPPPTPASSLPPTPGSRPPRPSTPPSSTDYSIFFLSGRKKNLRVASKLVITPTKELDFSNAGVDKDIDSGSEVIAPSSPMDEVFLNRLGATKNDRSSIDNNSSALIKADREESRRMSLSMKPFIQSFNEIEEAIAEENLAAAAATSEKNPAAAADLGDGTAPDCADERKDFPRKDPTELITCDGLALDCSGVVDTITTKRPDDVNGGDDKLKNLKNSRKLRKGVISDVMHRVASHEVDHHSFEREVLDHSSLNSHMAGLRDINFQGEEGGDFDVGEVNISDRAVKTGVKVVAQECSQKLEEGKEEKCKMDVVIDDLDKMLEKVDEAEKKNKQMLYEKEVENQKLLIDLSSIAEGEKVLTLKKLCQEEEEERDVEEAEQEMEEQQEVQCPMRKVRRVDNDLPLNINNKVWKCEEKKESDVIDVEDDEKDDEQVQQGEKLEQEQQGEKLEQEPVAEVKESSNGLSRVTAVDTAQPAARMQSSSMVVEHDFPLLKDDCNADDVFQDAVEDHVESEVEDHASNVECEVDPTLPDGSAFTDHVADFTCGTKSIHAVGSLTNEEAILGTNNMNERSGQRQHNDEFGYLNDEDEDSQMIGDGMEGAVGAKSLDADIHNAIETLEENLCESSENADEASGSEEEQKAADVKGEKEKDESLVEDKIQFHQSKTRLPAPLPETSSSQQQYYAEKKKLTLKRLGRRDSRGNSASARSISPQVKMRSEERRSKSKKSRFWAYVPEDGVSFCASNSGAEAESRIIGDFHVRSTRRSLEETKIDLWEDETREASPALPSTTTIEDAVSTSFALASVNAKVTSSRHSDVYRVEQRRFSESSISQRPCASHPTAPQPPSTSNVSQPPSTSYVSPLNTLVTRLGTEEAIIGDLNVRSSRRSLNDVPLTRDEAVGSAPPKQQQQQQQQPVLTSPTRKRPLETVGDYVRHKVKKAKKIINHISPKTKKKKKSFWYYLSPEKEGVDATSSASVEQSKDVPQSSAPVTEPFSNGDTDLTQLAELFCRRKSAVKASASVSSFLHREMVEISTGQSPVSGPGTPGSLIEKQCKEARREERRRQKAAEKEEKRRLKKLAKAKEKTRQSDENKDHENGESAPLPDDIINLNVSTFNDILEKSLSPKGKTEKPIHSASASSSVSGHQSRGVEPLRANYRILNNATSSVSSSGISKSDATASASASAYSSQEGITSPDANVEKKVGSYVCTPSRSGVRLSISKSERKRRLQEMQDSPLSPSSIPSSSLPPSSLPTTPLAPNSLPARDEYEATPTRKARVGIRLVRRNSSRDSESAASTPTRAPSTPTRTPSEADVTLTTTTSTAADIPSKTSQADPTTPRRKRTLSRGGGGREDASENRVIDSQAQPRTPSRRGSSRTCKEIARCSISDQLWSPPKANSRAAASSVSSSSSRRRLHSPIGPSKVRSGSASNNNNKRAAAKPVSPSSMPAKKRLKSLLDDDEKTTTPSFNASFCPLSDDDDAFENTLTLQAPPTRSRAVKPAEVFKSPPANSIPLMRQRDDSNTTPNTTPSRPRQTSVLSSPLHSSDSSPRVTPKSRQFDLPIAPPSSVGSGGKRVGSGVTPRPTKRPQSTPKRITSTPSQSSSKHSLQETSPCVLSPPLAPDYDDSNDFKPRRGVLDVGASPTKSQADVVKTCRVQLLRLPSKRDLNGNGNGKRRVLSGDDRTSSQPRNVDDDEDDFKPLPSSRPWIASEKLRSSPRKSRDNR